MIRRTMEIDDGQRAWLLISQVEHARISGELVRAWEEPFSEEVIAGIAHHDDGWATWERSPKIDKRRGRPLSFLEMPIADTLQIWDESIAAARRIGPLAGAIVAGHFMGLASGSEQATEKLATNWLLEMAAKRTGWLAEWQSLSPANTGEVADRDQSMLYAADLLSLWLCCDGPVDRVDADEIPNTEMKSRTAAVLGKYRFLTHSKTRCRDEIQWDGSIDPWPFGVTQVELATPAIAADVRNYETWAQLLTASWPASLWWRLRKTLPEAIEC